MSEPSKQLLSEIHDLLEECEAEMLAAFLGELANELEVTGDYHTVLMKLRGFKKNYKSLVGE